MAVSPEYRAFVEELFESVFPVHIRAMFGGAGIYSGDLMFGLIADERVYLKTDELNRPDFDAEGSPPFSYVTREGEHLSMSYYALPERLYDDPEELRVWAMKALDAALRGKSGKTKKPKKAGVKKGKPRALTNKPRKPVVKKTR